MFLEKFFFVIPILFLSKLKFLFALLILLILKLLMLDGLNILLVSKSFCKSLIFVFNFAFSLFKTKISFFDNS